MNPSHDDFSGSGLPPYLRHGQDQGQQQLSGFPFQVSVLLLTSFAVSDMISFCGSVCVRVYMNHLTFSFYFMIIVSK